MKTILLIICLLPIALFGQKVKIKWGKEYADKKTGFYTTNYLDTADDHHYFLNRSYAIVFDNLRSNYRITKVNLAGDVVDEYKSELLTDDNFNHFSKVLNATDKTYVLSTRISKSRDKFELYTSEFSAGKFSAPVLLYGHDFNPKDGYGSSYSYGLSELEGETKFSEDGKTFVFGNQIEIEDQEKENDKINFAVFNDQLELIWEKVQEFPYADFGFYANSMVVSNDGRDFFLAAALHTDKYKAFFDFKIFHITESGMAEYNIMVNKAHQIRSIAMCYDEVSKVLKFTGLYNQKRYMELEGIYTGRVEPKNKWVENLEFTPFTKNEKGKFSAKKEKIQKFNIIGTRKFKNGNFQVIAENSEMFFRHYDKEYYGQELFRSSDKTGVFTKAELLVYLLDQEGKLLNKKIIHKNYKQTSKLSTVEIIYDEEKTYLVFETKNGKAEKKKYGVKGFLYPITLMVTIPADGTVQSTKLLTSVKEDKFFLVSREGFVHDGEIIYGGGGQKPSEGALIGTGVRRLRFGKISLDGLD